MNKFFLIIYLMIFCSSMVSGCSLFHLPPPPMTEFNHQSYIFVGEVIGYTELIETENPDRKGRGIKIKPIEAINLPKPANDYYELFKFGVNSMCSPFLGSLNIAIGTKLRIVANEATLLPNRNSANKIRLESRIFDRLSMVAENDEFVTSVNFIFDYENLKSLQAKTQRMNDSRNQAAFNDFLFIETVKDLLRLEKSTLTKEREKILERLLYNPEVDFLRIINPSLGRLVYSSNNEIPGRSFSSGNQESTLERLTNNEKLLFKKREELEKSGYFKSTN